MKPDISEFSYGYALTSELVRTYGVRNVGAPVFPSLIEEGKLGYDVHVHGINLFLQFKLTDNMVRGTAKEAALLGVPHFRMHLRPLKHSDQHDLLLALENLGEEVYYAAPEFHSPQELNTAYDSSTVADRSAFWAPSAIGSLDGEEHYVAFLPGQNFGWVCSEPYRVERTHTETLLRERLPGRARSAAAREPSRDYWRELGDQLMALYRERRPHEEIAADRFESTRERRDPRDDASIISQTLFGCALLFVPME